MSHQAQGLISLSNISESKILGLFEKADIIKNEMSPKQSVLPSFHGTGALVFFENSTRTKLSFESALVRSGLHPYGIDSNSGSSVAKGETLEDTVLNIAAMQPKLVIVRCGDDLDLEALAHKINQPLINAGWGTKGHPTQALLDLYTIWKEKQLKGLRILFIGDVVHSRVAASHFEALNRFGVEIGICGPEIFKPKNSHKLNFKWFNNLKNGLEWANVVMLLRVQFERHSSDIHIQNESYHQEYGLNEKSLKWLASDALILHPGPVNRGVELSEDAFSDSRSRILKQVENGLYIRTALIRSILGGPL